MRGEGRLRTSTGVDCAAPPPSSTSPHYPALPYPNPNPNPNPLTHLDQGEDLALSHPKDLEPEWHDRGKVKVEVYVGYNMADGVSSIDTDYELHGEDRVEKLGGGGGGRVGVVRMVSGRAAGGGRRAAGRGGAREEAGGGGQAVGGGGQAVVSRRITVGRVIGVVVLSGRGRAAGEEGRGGVVRGRRGVGDESRP